MGQHNFETSVIQVEERVASASPMFWNFTTNFTEMYIFKLLVVYATWKYCFQVAHI